MKDVIIIGGGTSGLASAIYCGRLGLSSLVIGKGRSMISSTHLVENYPGIKSISGYGMSEKFVEHAESFGAEILDRKAESVSFKDGIFRIVSEGKEFKCRAVVFATGTKRRKLGIPGEEEFQKRGVSYCAICDGPFFRGREVAVVGGGNSAAKEALYLAEHASKVCIISRDSLNAEDVTMKAIGKNSKIKIIENTNVLEIRGEKTVNIILLDKEYDGSRELKVSGVFVEIGGIPQTKLAKAIGVELNRIGEMIVNRNSETNVPGIFAAGDCTDNPFKQVITGASQGVMAAWSAYGYLKKE